MRLLLLWCAACLLAACSMAERTERPNFLIILADDMGYSDLGVMGSEIRTPNIDRLAGRGLLMTHFRVHMLCSPTRAMLLTGADSHPAGYGTMAGEFTPAIRGQPGYETYLTERVTTIANVLRDGGYHTYIAGKWDMGGHGNPAFWPDQRGFEESFVLVEGSGSHYDNSPSLLELASVTYVENGREIIQPDDFYSSRNYADKIIEYIGRHKPDGKPFFAYLPFTAPHYPLHAPDEYIDHYAGVYEQGYEAVRALRIERMRKAGLMGAQQVAARHHPAWPAWDDLDADMRSLEARRMQVYAAMMEAMDFHVGRVLDYLERENLADNTLVVFLSDNGAEGGNPLDFYGQPGFDWAEDSFDVGLENLGRPGSYAWLGAGWAHVGSTPLRYFKGFPTEGGIRTPAVFSFPGRIEAGRVSSVSANVLDLPVTLLDYAGVEHPGVADNGAPMPPLRGQVDAPVSWRHKQAGALAGGLFCLCHDGAQGGSAGRLEDNLDERSLGAGGTLVPLQPGRGPGRAQRPGHESSAAAGGNAGALGRLCRRQRRYPHSGLRNRLDQSFLPLPVAAPGAALVRDTTVQSTSRSQISLRSSFPSLISLMVRPASSWGNTSHLSVSWI